MNPECAKCRKAVYPTEKLMAIDRAWHKGCFKCTECQITLNLKTFQSSEHKPYCQAHLPRQQARGIAGDSVEVQRLKNVSNIVSNVQYRAGYEKSKGDALFGQVGLDAPALKQVMKNSEQQSNVKYHQSYQEGHYVSSITTGQKNASNDSPRAQPVSSKRPSVAEPTKSDFAPPRSRNASVSINQQPQRAIQASEVLKQSANSLREVKQRAFDEMQNEVEQKEQVVQQINEEEQGSNEAAEQIKEEAHVVQQVLEAPEAVLGQSNDPNAMYCAAYAYHPEAEDELEFEAGDIIVDAQLVAEGWLYGVNQRTGKAGLVPEPYTTRA